VKLEDPSSSKQKTPFQCILSQFNPVHIITTSFSKILLNPFLCYLKSLYADVIRPLNLKVFILRFCSLRSAVHVT